MAIKAPFKSPYNGIKNDAYLNKYSVSITNNSGLIEMKVWENQEDRNDPTCRAYDGVIKINIGNSEVVRTEEVDGQTVEHELVQINYDDIKTEYDAFWAKIYQIIKNKKVSFSGIETDLSQGVDII